MFAVPVTDVMFLQSKGHDYVMCVHEYVRLQSAIEDTISTRRVITVRLNTFQPDSSLAKLLLLYRA